MKDILSLSEDVHMIFDFQLSYFFQLFNHLTKRAEFWYAISIWYIDYSDYGYKDVLNGLLTELFPFHKYKTFP